MYFDIKDAANGQYYFRIVASNGQTLCHSESYTTKENVKNAIMLIQKYDDDADVRDSSN